MRRWRRGRRRNRYSRRSRGRGYGRERKRYSLRSINSSSLNSKRRRRRRHAWLMYSRRPQKGSRIELNPGSIKRLRPLRTRRGRNLMRTKTRGEMP